MPQSAIMDQQAGSSKSQLGQMPQMMDFNPNMMDFSTSQPSATNISEPIQILKYLIEIWPKNQEPVL